MTRKTWISLEEMLAAKPVEDRLDIEANFPRSLSGSSWWVVGGIICTGGWWVAMLLIRCLVFSQHSPSRRHRGWSDVLQQRLDGGKDEFNYQRITEPTLPGVPVIL